MLRETTSETPAKPAEDAGGGRRPRRKVPLGPLVIVGSVVALVAALALVPFALSAPPAEPFLDARPLEDGTRLRLDQVTFGRVHSLATSVSPLQRIAEWLGRPLSRAGTAQHSTGDDRLVAWITRRPPSGKATLSLDGWQDWQGFDEHGCPFGDGNRFLQGLGHGGNSTTSGGRGSQLQLGTAQPSFQRFVGGAELSTFPRRQPQFQLRLLHDAGTVELIVPNPQPGPYPTWTPEPVPATQRDGDLAVTLVRLQGRDFEAEIGPRKFPQRAVDTEYRLAQGGRETKDWQLSTEQLTDATGNTSHPWQCLLCSHEAAWKLTARFWRRPQARFAANETWITGDLPVPATGQVLPLHGEATVQGVNLRLVAIAGAGRYDYVNGVPKAKKVSPEQLATYRELNGVSVGSSSSTNNGLTRTEINVGGQSHVAIEASGLTPDQRVTVAGVDDRGRRFYSENESGANNTHFLCMKFPPGAQRLTLTVAVHGSRSVDFLVKPPAFKRS